MALFLENNTETISHKEQFSLNITSDCIDENEAVLYEQGIKNYYREKYLSSKNRLHRNLKIACILGFLGVLTLILAQFIAFKYESVIWTETIDIAAWVFLWETVDILIFKTRELQIDESRFLAFYEMPIKFLPLNKQIAS